MTFAFNALFKKMAPIAMVGLLALSAGCKTGSGDNTTAPPAAANGGLTLYVTANAPEMIQKAKQDGLAVKMIDQNSPASELNQMLMNLPLTPGQATKYFVVANSVQHHVITGGSLADFDNTKTELLLAKLNEMNQAGVKSLTRLQPTPGKAKLAIFTDFQCPYCRMMDVNVVNWEKTYGDKLEIEYINFPLPFHPFAHVAAISAECARLQNKYQPYAHDIFAHQKDFTPTFFAALAQKDGIEMMAFNQCVKTEQTAPKVQEDQQFGGYMGVNGTPTAFLNGQSLFGLDPATQTQRISQAVATLK